MHMKDLKALKTAMTCALVVVVLPFVSVLGQAPAATTVVSTVAPVIPFGSLSPTFRNLMGFMGTRLAVAGNERLTLNGTITLADGSKTAAQVIMELPDHLRYVQTQPPRVVVYDGTTVQTSTGPATTADNNLVESFVLDGVERLLIAQTQGLALRMQGPHIKLVSTASPPNPTPLCELYLLSDKERFITSLQRKQKLYCFDSRTRLLSAAFYQNPGPGSQSTAVETRWSNWGHSGSNQIPGTVTRFENGKIVFSLAVSGNAVAATASDGIFTKP
jgi:hypothetical protein